MMGHLKRGFAALAVLAAPLWVGPVWTGPVVAQEATPNILVIMADDVG